MSIFATQEQVDILKKRARAWETNGFSRADPYIVPLITVMNKLENIACVWSCEGHFDPRRIGEGRLSDFYLMMAVTAEGFETVSRLYDNLRNRLYGAKVLGDIRRNNYYSDNPGKMPFDDPIAYSSITQVGLKITSRIWPIPDYQSGELQDAKYYNVVILSGETGRDNVKAAFFAELMGALKTITTVDETITEKK